MSFDTQRQPVQITTARKRAEDFLGVHGAKNATEQEIQRLLPFFPGGVYIGGYKNKRVDQTPSPAATPSIEEWENDGNTSGPLGSRRS